MTPTQELIAATEAHLINSRRDFDMVDHVILGQGFIIVTESGFPLDFDCKDKVVTNPRIAQYAGRVLRMTREDAETVAQSVTDGAGRHGTPIHVRHAILNEIAQREELLSALADVAA